MFTKSKPLPVVLLIVFSAGVTPIAIRYTQAEGVPSLVIVFIRLWLISIGLFPFVWHNYRAEMLALTRKQLALVAFAGFWLALNLMMLFLSLEYTSVLISSVLRRITPLWIIMPEIVVLGAVFTYRIWWSIGLTVVGVALIALGGSTVLETGSQPVLGAGMAAFGALCFGIYLLIGRQLNNRIPPLLYSWLVFLAAGIVITAFVVVSGTPILGYSLAGYLWVILVTFLAQVLGQISINVALQHFSATAMAIILQVGVVVSAFIALFTFNEVPTLWQATGSIMVIAGVLLATIEQSRQQVRTPRE